MGGSTSSNEDFKKLPKYNYAKGNRGEIVISQDRHDPNLQGVYLPTLFKREFSGRRGIST